MWGRDPSLEHGSDLAEFTIRQNGGELQGLIEGRRCTGGFKIVESEIHSASIAGIEANAEAEKTVKTPAVTPAQSRAE